jgi:hypothetical protein
MRVRSSLGALLLVGVLAPLTSCSNDPSLTSITVTPNVMNFGGPGLFTQLTAIGSYTHPGHPAETRDITALVNWASSTTQCVTVTNPGGLITAGQNNCSGILITASMQGFNGIITGTMTVNVTQPGSQGSGDAVQINVSPTSATMVPGGNQQFQAIGYSTSGTQVALTNPINWSSSNSHAATINQGTGLATGVAAGSTTISAGYTNSDGTPALTGTASLTVQ